MAWLCADGTGAFPFGCGKMNERNCSPSEVFFLILQLEVLTNPLTRLCLGRRVREIAELAGHRCICNGVRFHRSVRWIDPRDVEIDYVTSASESERTHLIGEV